MKHIVKAVFEPLYYLYQRKVSNKVINFLRKYPIFQYVLALVVSIAIIYIAVVIYEMK